MPPCLAAWLIPACSQCRWMCLCAIGCSCVTVPSILHGCTPKLTQGGAGQESRVDPLPPLLFPPGGGPAKVVYSSFTTVPAMGTSLTGFKTQVLESDGELGKSKCVELGPSQHHSLGVLVLSWDDAGFPMGAAATVQLSAPSFQQCVGTRLCARPRREAGSRNQPWFCVRHYVHSVSSWV